MWFDVEERGERKGGRREEGRGVEEERKEEGSG